MEDAPMKPNYLQHREVSVHGTSPQRAAHAKVVFAIVSSMCIVKSSGAAPALTRYPSELFSTVRPCSCDCCQVSLRLPSEVERLSNGVELKHKCTTPEQETDQCPNQCEMSNSESVLTSAIGQVDYARYCLFKCIPSVPTAGTMCQRQAADESWVARVPDGNGRRLPVGSASGRPDAGSYPGGNVPSPAGGPSMYTWTSVRYSPAPAVQMDSDDDKPSWQKAVEKKKKDRDDAVKAAERDGEEKQRMIYDLRKLYAERLRAQAGAMASHEIAAGERVRLSEHAISRNAELLSKAATVAEDLQTSLDAAVTQTQANATIAREAAAKADQVFKQGKVAVKSILEDTRQATMQMVQQGVQEIAREEAQTFAQRMFWDKPLSYGRILAYQAAEPYQTQMLAANQKVSEYENQASSLYDKAKATQQKAEEVAANLNATEASADAILKVIDKRKARNLLRRSREISQRADQMWKTAQATRATVRQWQNASWVATVRTSWEFETARAAATSADPCPTASTPANTAAGQQQPMSPTMMTAVAR